MFSAIIITMHTRFTLAFSSIFFCYQIFNIPKHLLARSLESFNYNLICLESFLMSRVILTLSKEIEFKYKHFKLKKIPKISRYTFKAAELN